MGKRTEGGEGHRSKFRLEDLPTVERREYLECFLRHLMESFRSAEEGQKEKKGGKTRQREGKGGEAEKGDSKAGDASKRAIMAKVSKDRGRKIDVRQFDTFLRFLYSDGYLRLGYQRSSERAEALQKRFSGLEKVTVVGGSDRDRFAQAAAEDFIQRMFEIDMSKAKGEPLNVGIVSGDTTGLVVRAAMALKWIVDLGKEASELRKVRVFALNVCLTEPSRLAGNATILAYQLAEKINNEARDPRKAEAYGLSAPLLVEKRGLYDVDRAPQTYEVVKVTEPFRVLKKLRAQGEREIDPKENDTELDIVLTGVGELPKNWDREESGSTERESDDGHGGSIFYNLAKEFDIDMVNLRKKRIVGDIAFTAICSDGSEAALLMGKSATPGDADQADHRPEFVFYSAVQLGVLAAMTKDKSKSVILVARHTDGKYKVPAIFASVAGEKRRYASRLVIDEQTAAALAHY